MDCCCKHDFLALEFRVDFPCFIRKLIVLLVQSGDKEVDYDVITCLPKQVGGVHSHLISRVQRDKSRVGCFISQNDIMMTVFPMFQQHIEPHLVHAHVSDIEAI